MFNSAVLDVVIGVMFVFLLFSILCAAIREGIEGWLKTRAAYLAYGIRELLNDRLGRGLAQSLFNHPLVYSLYAGDYAPPIQPSSPANDLPPPETKKPGILARGKNLPSYIPSRNFALALMDIAARGPDSTRQNDAAAPVITLDQIRSGVANLANGPVQRVLLTAIDTAQGDLDRAQKNLEAWYDSAMDRVSGWYKRSSQTVIFIIGLVAAVSCNINTITIADYLYKNGPARASLVAQAERAAGNEEYLKKTYDEAKTQIESLGLPFGWEDPQAAVRPDALGIASAIVGWLLMAFAAMLGAPFWFDVLNKIMVIRSTVKPHEKSPEEASEDRQLAGNQPTEGPARSTTSSQVALAQDCCDVDMMANPTVDEDLPAARGGIA